MSRGKKQEMEEGLIDVASGIKKSNTAVNAPGKPGEPIDTSQGKWEDLGGPTPQNYKVDDDSAKLKTPGGNLKQVSDVVTNRKGKTLKQGDEAEVTDEQEVVAEEPATEEVVAEAEVSEEEVVEEINIEDDVNALLGGEELSEEFREKAKLVFETALNAKVAEVKKLWKQSIKRHSKKI